MKHSTSLALVLFGTWLLWSGYFTPLLTGFGIASCLLVLFICHRMQILDEEGAPVEVISFRTLLYIPWLAFEIVKSNVDVARRIVSPGLPIEPQMIRVTASQRSDVGRVIYANSITLTPGTVTVDVEGDWNLVHALTGETAAGVQSGEMDAKVTALEGKA